MGGSSSGGGGGRFDEVGIGDSLVGKGSNGGDSIGRGSIGDGS